MNRPLRRSTAPAEEATAAAAAATPFPPFYNHWATAIPYAAMPYAPVPYATTIPAAATRAPIVPAAAAEHEHPRKRSTAILLTVTSPAAPPIPPRASLHLTDDERQAMLQVMLQNTELHPETGQQQLKKGAAVAIAARFQVHNGTVMRIWKQALESRKEHPLGLANVSRRRTGGGKRKWSREDFDAKIEALPYEERTTVKSIAKHLGLSKSTAMQYARLYLIRTAIDDDE